MNCEGCGAPMRLDESKDCLICDYCGHIDFPNPNADGVRVLGEPSDRYCPLCRTHLIHAGITGRRLLYCETCRGMLIPVEVFSEIIQDLRARDDAPAQTPYPINARDVERQIQCPACGQWMDTHPYGGPGNIIIDNCPRCELNWLDHGELWRIVHAPDRHYDE